MSRKKKQKNTALSPRQKVTNVYLMLMFGVFPVFCTDGFFNIRHDRYYFFLALSLVLLLFWGVTLLGGDRKNAIGKLTVTDWAMLGFWGVCLLSTVFSLAPLQALLGTAGRNNGLLLMAVYVGIYFAVSRYGRPGPVTFAVLGVISAFVSILTVLNFFMLDPLNMLEPLTTMDRKIFFSTIGNKNLLSGYLCITLPVLTVLFVETRRKWLRILSLVCLTPGFAALMAADSDSGLLGLGVFGAVFLVRYLRHPGKLKRFLLVWTVMLLSARLLQPFMLLPAAQTKSMSHLQRLFVLDGAGFGLLLGMGSLTAFLYLLDHRKPGLVLPKTAQWVLFALMGTALLAILGGILFCTLNRELPLQGIWYYFRLDDSWGTNRGFMWRKSMESFWEFSLWRKLFGSGPDTFYYVFEPYFPELTKFWTTSTNAAHNEYLNYLITVGVLGASAYLTALISGITHCFRSAKENPTAVLFCAAVICYGAQAFVSIAQPITTPLLVIFLALSAGTGNKTVG